MNEREPAAAVPTPANEPRSPLRRFSFRLVPLSIAAALALAACGTGGDGNGNAESGEIFASGSSTVEPITNRVAEAHAETNSDFQSVRSRTDDDGRHDGPRHRL